LGRKSPCRALEGTPGRRNKFKTTEAGDHEESQIVGARAGSPIVSFHPETQSDEIIKECDLFGREIA
jgi:hypothetical protein